MNNLTNAIQLYNEDKINKLKLDYILSDDKREKQALKVTLINLKSEKNK